MNAPETSLLPESSPISMHIIDNFGNLKEEAAKFLVSRYHDRKIWLDKPIAITGKLINFITDNPLNGEPIPIGSKNPYLLERFIGSTQKGKNSKGLQINSIESSTVKWTALIISIFLTIFGHPSNIKLDMLEVIEGVASHAKMYSWANYLADLFRTNCEKFQEQGTPIRFCSLLIWIAMSKISPVGRPEFTILSTPTMYNYSCFKIRSKVLGIPSPKQIFTMWLQEVKSSCHKWRVLYNIL